MQRKISEDIDKKKSKYTREYYLTEQLLQIKKELGIENNSKDSLISTFKDKASKLKMSEAVKKVFDEVNNL